MSRVRFLLLLFIAISYNNNYTECCSERKCASIVSKCLLAQNCKCAKNDYYCYHQCKQCLGKHYYEACCDCVEVCVQQKEQHLGLSSKSHVEEFDGLPELFNALVANADGETAGDNELYDDDENNWRLYTYTVELDAHKNKPKHTNKIKKSNYGLITLNCTVIYLHHCTSWNKCRHSCRAIGASSYRWFHDGCCECIGPTCVNYGINESRCKFCPHPDDLFDDDEEFADNAEDNQIHVMDFN